MERRINSIFNEHLVLMQEASKRLAEKIRPVVEEISARLKRGGKIYIIGNGGSAADALHWAGELMGRFYFDRPGIPAVALMDNPSLLTAMANDYGYNKIFARQLATLVTDNDIVLAISTSGSSPSILDGLAALSGRRCFRVGFTGKDGGKMKGLVDVLFEVPSKDTPRIQEVHALLGHIICELVEAELYGKAAGEWSNS